MLCKTIGLLQKQLKKKKKEIETEKELGKSGISISEMKD